MENEANANVMHAASAKENNKLTMIAFVILLMLLTALVTYLLTRNMATKNDDAQTTTGTNNSQPTSPSTGTVSNNNQGGSDAFAPGTNPNISPNLEFATTLKNGTSQLKINASIPDKNDVVTKTETAGGKTFAHIYNADYDLVLTLETDNAANYGYDGYVAVSGGNITKLSRFLVNSDQGPYWQYADDASAANCAALTFLAGSAPTYCGHARFTLGTAKLNAICTSKETTGSKNVAMCDEVVKGLTVK